MLVPTSLWLLLSGLAPLSALKISVSGRCQWLFAPVALLFSISPLLLGELTLLSSMMGMWFLGLWLFRCRLYLKPGFIILTYCIALAAAICLSAQDFITLLIGLEVYTFATAFLLLSGHNNSGCRKCVLRFLLLSAVMSAIYLLGCSLLYVQFGSLSFEALNQASVKADHITNISNVLILGFLLFKLGCAPFHTWLIELYRNASYMTVLFLDTVWKFLIVVVFVQVIDISTLSGGRNMIYPFAIISMLVGAFLPIFQSDIRKFLASSSVGHIGLMLAALIPSTHGAPEAATNYAAYYAISSGCFIIGIMKAEAQHFHQLQGTMTYSPLAAWLVLLSMFAMAGMPPFGNFLAKLDIFKLLASSQNYVLLSVAAVHSVLSIVYIIKWGRFLFHEQFPHHKIN